MKALEIKELSLRFGGLLAVSQVSFDLRQGEVLAVIGPNGAGKTSLFNVVTGLYQASSGQIRFFGKELVNTNSLPNRVSALAVAVIFALAFMLAINAQELWDVMIISRYVYQQPFSYSESFLAGLGYLQSLDSSWNIVPFLAALLFAIAALIKFERASKFTPVVAARAGLARTFQNLRLMGKATVAENIRGVINASAKPGLFSAMLGLPGAKKFEKKVEVAADEVLTRLGLSEYSSRQADSLPYGLQRRVEIARALATNPKVLLLDEPAAGLNPSESQELLLLVKKISQSGITVLLIEHDMAVVMALSDRIVVLHHGEKIAEGTPAEVRQHPQVIKAYLGKTEQL